MMGPVDADDYWDLSDLRDAEPDFDSLTKKEYVRTLTDKEVEIKVGKLDRIYKRSEVAEEIEGKLRLAIIILILEFRKRQNAALITEGPHQSSSLEGEIIESTDFGDLSLG